MQVLRSYLNVKRFRAILSSEYILHVRLISFENRSYNVLFHPRIYFQCMIELNYHQITSSNKMTVLIDEKI